MKRRVACLALVVLLGSAHAEDAPQVATPGPGLAAELAPLHQGYAFDQRDILIRQRLFGLAHGVSLLAAACLDLPAHSVAIQDAYATWHAKQAGTIKTLVVDLSRYYFGPRADEAEWPDLTRALKLANRIEPALSELTLHAACASLPEAIGRSRYALDKLLADSADAEPAE